MERSRYLMAGLLILSVCLNIYALNRIGDLSAAIREARNQVLRMQDSLDHGLDWVNNAVEKMREEARWMSRVEVTPGEPLDGIQPMTLSWQVREYPVGASVTLYLRERGRSEFTPYPAENTGGGGFRITFDHTIQPEPHISIAYSDEGSSSAKRESVVSESSGVYRTGQYEYYVTMTDGREMKTTEVSQLNIRQEAGDLVSPVSVDIRAVKGQVAFDITVHETPKPERYHYRLQGVSLKVRDGDLVVKELTLVSQGTIEAPTPQGKGEIPVFEGRLEDYPAPSEVLLVLRYGDGVSTEFPVKYLMAPIRLY
jgi:hypothetical protein